MNDDLVPRIGTFFIMVGIGLMVLFASSELAGSVRFEFFVYSLGALIAGFILRRRRAPPPESGRFRTARRISDRQRQSKEQRKQKKLQKQQKK